MTCIPSKSAPTRVAATVAVRLRCLGAFAGIALLSGCALPPSGTSIADVQNYEAAVASIGCVMRDDTDYLPVEFQTGLTREQVIAMTEYELAAKKAVKLEDGGVKLTTGACA